MRTISFAAVDTGEMQVNLFGAGIIFFLNFSTPCIENVNNTGTRYVRIMKQTAL